MRKSIEHDLTRLTLGNVVTLVSRIKDKLSQWTGRLNSRRGDNHTSGKHTRRGSGDLKQKGKVNDTKIKQEILQEEEKEEKQNDLWMQSDRVQWAKSSSLI